MVVHPSVPAKDLKEFLALLKAKPGDLNYASSGPGTPYHMAGELFKAMSGTNIVHVPASRQRRRAHRRDRRPRADDDRRHHHHGADRRRTARCARSAPPAPSAPRCCPTCRPSPKPACPATRPPSGSASWRRPARRKPIVDKLNAEINKVLAKPEIKEAWAKQGAEPLIMTPAEFDEYLRGRHRQMGQGHPDRRHQGRSESAMAEAIKLQRERRRAHRSRPIRTRSLLGVLRGHAGADRPPISAAAPTSAAPATC